MKKIKLTRASVADAGKIWEMQRTAFAQMLEKYKDYETSPANEPLEKTVKRLSSPSTYFYFISVSGEIVGAKRVIDKKSEGGNKRISPVFIMPEHRGNGYAQSAIKAVEAIHGADGWELDTILQEAGNCHLYEKMGYVKSGRTQRINDKMTLVFYEKP